MTKHTVTLNIGLQTNLIPSTAIESDDAVEYIIKRAREVSPELLADVAWRVDEAKYDHDGEIRTERTLVMRFSSDDRTALAAAIANVDLWAERLHQDCIALELAGPVDSSGALLGPKAADWGPFDPAYFIRY